MRFAITTLGCKVNQVESDGMAEWLTQRGHARVLWHDPADVYLVNTCSVTAMSDAKSRQKIAGVRKANPDALVAVCGCMTEGQNIDLPGVDLVGGTRDRLAFLVSLCDLAERRADIQPEALARAQLETCPSAQPESPAPARDTNANGKRPSFEPLPVPAQGGPRTRAFLKIQDGCDNFCAYCVIPYRRGTPRSLPLADAGKQIQALSDAPEIVLTGIEIAKYGRDLPGSPTLADLIALARQAAPNARLRLGSLEPPCVDDALIEAMAAARVCPQFHLSLQSGCDETLRAMERRYDTALYAGRVDVLRRVFPGCAVTTDLIVGFPGESERNFEQSLRFVEEQAPARVHVFPYSKRPGTKAAALDGHLTVAAKKERAGIAGALARRLAETYAQSAVGQTRPVLFERDRDGWLSGHADTYVTVTCPGHGLSGQTRAVEILSAQGDACIGRLSAR